MNEQGKTKPAHEMEAGGGAEINFFREAGRWVAEATVGGRTFRGTARTRELAEERCRLEISSAPEEPDRGGPRAQRRTEPRPAKGKGDGDRILR